MAGKFIGTKYGVDDKSGHADNRRMSTAGKKRGRPPIEAPLRRHQFRVTDEQLARWQRAADKEGLTLSAWVRQVCDEATKQRPKKGARKH